MQLELLISDFASVFSTVYIEEIEAFKRFKPKNSRLNGLAIQILDLVNNSRLPVDLLLPLKSFFFRNLFMCPKFTSLKVTEFLENLLIYC